MKKERFITCVVYIPMKLWDFLLPAVYFLLFGCSPTSTGTKKEIALLPLGPSDTFFLRVLSDELHRFYGLKAEILPAESLPQRAFYIPRRRYRADSLISILKNREKKYDLIMGITESDISTTHGGHNDWGVFGLGYCPGRSCVISLHRLRKASANNTQLQERFIKVALHEAGHNLGLPHCENDTCLMTDARGLVGRVDGTKKKLCRNCSHAVLSL